MEKRFIMVLSGLNGTNDYFRDIYQDPRVEVFSLPVNECNSKIISTLRRIHLSKRVNNIIDLPFKGIWKCRLSEVKFEKGIKYYIIFTNGSIYPVKAEFLVDLRKKYDVKLILFVKESYDSPWSDRERYYQNAVGFDHIYTFDPNDAKKYGFTYTELPYSVFDIPSDGEIKYDIHFIGRNKGDRLTRLESVCDYFDSHGGVTMNCRIAGVPRNLRRKHTQISYTSRFVEYPEVVRQVQECNCILEILTGHFGATLRYYEAVCYNKKFLTTNKNVVNLPFYNPDYIHVFADPEDIDCDWVRKREKIDYHYDGRFSPSHFIDKIEKLE